VFNSNSNELTYINMVFTQIYVNDSPISPPINMLIHSGIQNATPPPHLQHDPNPARPTNSSDMTLFLALAFLCTAIVLIKQTLRNRQLQEELKLVRHNPAERSWQCCTCKAWKYDNDSYYQCHCHRGTGRFHLKCADCWDYR
jgi:hypothetical protein